MIIFIYIIKIIVLYNYYCIKKKVQNKICLHRIYMNLSILLTI